MSENSILPARLAVRVAVYLVR